MQQWWDEFLQRASPISGGSLTPALVGATAIVALALVMIRPLWEVAKIAVTMVHELGHAMIGIVFGRRFNGFVVRGDMSGHAITTGRDRGFGLFATTWAGYPAPAVFAFVLVASTVFGYAAPVLTGVLFILLISVTRIRSFLTAAAVFGTLAGLGALWWFRLDQAQTAVFLTISGVLVVGAWRQLAAVARQGGPESDPGQLARQTRIPQGFWIFTFGVVILAATAGIGWITAVGLGYLTLP